MKKTIFKGTINGKSFDSVQSYNEEMTRVISAGESVVAESHTETVDTDDNKDFDLPGLYDEEFYIDRLVTGDNDKDAELYATEIEKLSKYYDDFKVRVKNLSNEEVENFCLDLKDAVECVGEDEESNTDLIKELNEKKKDLLNRIEKIDKELNIANNSTQVINLYKDFYEDLLNSTKKCQCNHDDSCCNCDECCCNSHNEKVETPNEKIKTVDDAINTIQNIFKTIFG